MRKNGQSIMSSSGQLRKSENEGLLNPRQLDGKLARRNPQRERRGSSAHSNPHSARFGTVLPWSKTTPTNPHANGDGQAVSAVHDRLRKHVATDASARIIKRAGREGVPAAADELNQAVARCSRSTSTKTTNTRTSAAGPSGLSTSPRQTPNVFTGDARMLVRLVKWAGSGGGNSAYTGTRSIASTV